VEIGKRTGNRARRGRHALVRGAGAAGAVIALATAGTAIAGPAAADPSCPDGHHCVFYSTVGAARHNYFSGDRDFRGDAWYLSNGNQHGSALPNLGDVDNSVWSASNSSTGGYRSVYWYGYNYSNYLFCVNPGGRVEHTELSDDGVDGNYAGQRDEAGSLSLQSGSSGSCFS
jgi:hypothetical protein